MEHRQRHPCSRIRCSRNRCAWNSASASSGPAPEQRNRPPPPTACTGSGPAQQYHHASADQRPEQQRTPRRRPGLFLLPIFHALPPARPAGSADRHALGVAAVATMTTPAHRSRSRSHRPPPAPGRISTASAAPDDHASSRPPHTMTTHQRQPCPTCTAPTACQPCQTSQQQRSHQRRHRGGQARQRRPPAAACNRCRLPDDPPRSTPQNGHFAPPPEGSDSPPNGIEL